MIYFFCGAAKHGSHFQRFIVEESLKQRGIAYKIAGNPIFHDHRLAEGRALLAELSVQDDVVLCKGHWGARRERDALLAVRNLRVFLIWRNLFDVMISSYYYDINKFGRHYRDFDDFWRHGGRALYAGHHLYRRVWNEQLTTDRVCHVSYDDLRSDFAVAVRPMLSFAGIDGVDLERLQAELTIDKMRETRDDPDGKFFRKGQSGEHRSFGFSDDVLRDFSRLGAMGTARLKALMVAERGRGLPRRVLSRLQRKWVARG